MNHFLPTPGMRILRMAALLALAGLTSLSSSTATNLYWDANGSTAGAGATPDGTWGTSSFWNTDSAGGAGTFQSSTASTDDLFFVAGPNGTDSGLNNFTVTVNGSVNANKITFQSLGDITIGNAVGGGTITLGAGGLAAPDDAFGTTDNSANPIINSNIILNANQNWVMTRGTLTVNGSISGTGNLALSGNFAKTFTGSNSYIGATSISNAAVTLSGSGTFGTGDVTMVGTFSGITFSHSTDITIGNNIGGAGSSAAVSKTGGSTLTLTGANSFTGGTWIQNGAISVGSINGGLGSGTIRLGNTSNTGTLIYTGSANETITRTISMNGGNNGNAAIQNDGTGTLNFTGSLTHNANGSRQLILRGSNTGNNQFQSVISNSTSPTSVTKNEGGKWILTGDNTYTGATMINGGAMIINGNQGLATGLVTINDTAILGGNGILGGELTLNSGGRIAPGTSAGTLTGAALNWNSGGILDFELGSVSDRLVLTGGLWEMAEGGAYGFHFTDAGGLTTGLYTLVNFATTTFETGTDFSFSSNIPGLMGDFVLNANNLQFNVTAVPEPGVTILTLLPLAAYRRRRAGAS